MRLRQLIAMVMLRGGGHSRDSAAVPSIVIFTHDGKVKLTMHFAIISRRGCCADPNAHPGQLSSRRYPRPLRTHPAFFPLGPLTSSPERSIMAYAGAQDICQTQRHSFNPPNEPSPPSHCQ
jgi:hypothetical protein